MGLSEQVVLFRQPRQRGKGRATGIVRPKQGFLAVQDGWVGAPPIVDAGHDSIAEVDAYSRDQGREGGGVERLISQK